MNISNYLTLLRIFLVPVLVAVLLTGRTPYETLTQSARLLAVAIFAIAALTDVLDGYLARLRNEVTRLGKLLDPIADKILVSAAFVSLVQLGLAPAWIVVIILGREFAVSGLRLIAATEGMNIEVSRFGKYKMISQVLAVGFLIVSNQTRPVGIAFLYLVMVLAVVSMIGYIRKFWRGLKPERRQQLARRRSFREMKEHVLTTTRSLREHRRLLREQRRKAREARAGRRRRIFSRAAREERRKTASARKAGFQLKQQ